VKQKPKPRKGRAKAENRVIITVFKGSAEYRDWMVEYAQYKNLPLTALIERCVAADARASKYRRSPLRKLKIGRAS
jgi:putative aminopeptidase FrvX